MAINLRFYERLEALAMNPYPLFTFVDYLGMHYNPASIGDLGSSKSRSASPMKFHVYACNLPS